MATKKIEIAERIDNLESMRKERDMLVKKRKDSDHSYKIKNGVRKNPPTAQTEREIELRRLIRLQQNAIYQKQRKKDADILLHTKEDLLKLKESLDERENQIKLKEIELETKERELNNKEKLLKKR